MIATAAVIAVTAVTASTTLSAAATAVAAAAATAVVAAGWLVLPDTMLLFDAFDDYWVPCVLLLNFRGAEGTPPVHRANPAIWKNGWNEWSPPGAASTSRGAFLSCSLVRFACSDLSHTAAW